MKVDTKVLLEHKAMKVFIEVIASTGDHTIRKCAATNIMALSFSHDGKVQACEEDAVAPLVYVFIIIIIILCTCVLVLPGMPPVLTTHV
jgi:hypothetical protein